MAPKYEQLVQTLRQTLPQWYADGQRRLPCEQELAARFSVSRQTRRQAAPVQNVVILRKIADQRVLVRCDQFGEDAEFFPAEKLRISSPIAAPKAATGTRPLASRRWS